MIVNIARLNKELTAFRTEKIETVKQMTSLEEQLKALVGEKATLEEKVKTLESQLVETKKDGAAVVVAVSESVNEQVVKKMAALGVAEGTVTEEVIVAKATSTDPSELYKTFDALKGKEKIDFFQKNEKVILKAMKSLHYAPLNVVKQ